MKIQSSGGPSATTSAARAQPQAAGGFGLGAPALRATAGPLPAAAVGAVHSLDALLALQEAPGPAERRRRAVKRAGGLLDALDSLKIALLDGEASPNVLRALQSAVQENRSQTDEPQLEGLLDEIETRAAVELAKQEMAERGSAKAA